MKKIIFATGNEDKMKEIRRILADPSLEILSLKDAGIHADIDENGKREQLRRRRDQRDFSYNAYNKRLLRNDGS